MSVIPFSPDEMKPVGMYPGYRGAPGNPILNYPISTRENFKLWMDKKAMWMPSSQELAMWNPGILADNVARAFVMEGSFGLPTDLINKDYFGIDWEYVPTVNGAIVHPGSPKVPEITEWEKYIEFPNLDDLDWASAAKLYDEKGDQTRPMRTAVFNGFFERLISFVDMADALFFLIDEDAQPAVHRLFDKLADFYDGLFKHLSESIKPDLIWFHDDWGSQRAPLFSLDLCREMLVPYIKRVVDSAHKYGMGFEFHSCGHLELLVPAMIEAGCDIWQGQSMNDKAKLFREYGDDIKMSVGFPTLPEDATEAQIDDAVGAFLDTFPYNVYCELTMVGTPGVYAKVYEESRKRLSK